MFTKTKLLDRGFTMVETLIVIVLLGLLVAITYSYAVPKYRDRAYLERSNSELHTMANALTLYVAKYNDYPADVSRNLPSGIQQFLQGQYKTTWPDAPWPDSVYDYDRWDDWSYHDAGELPGPIIQISIRMCDAGDDVTCKANANKYLQGIATPAALASWDSYSSVYYCIHGPCRSHQTQPANWPGYCVNCSGKSNFF